MAIEGGSVSQEKTTKPTPEEQVVLASIREGGSWPTADYLVSHPRVLDAVLASPEGVTTIKEMLEKAVPADKREDFLNVAQRLLNESKKDSQRYLRIGQAGVVGSLGGGAALASDYLSQIGIEISPAVEIALFFLSLLVAGYGIRGGTRSFSRAQTLEHLLVETFGPDVKYRFSR